MKIKTTDIHHHLKKRMEQRGINTEEIETTINSGWNADDADPGTFGKVYVFNYNNFWEGKFFEEKEVTVYYKIKDGKIILLTAKARYGKNFVKRGE